MKSLAAGALSSVKRTDARNGTQNRYFPVVKNSMITWMSGEGQQQETHHHDYEDIHEPSPGFKSCVSGGEIENDDHLSEMQIRLRGHLGAIPEFPVPRSDTAR